MSGKEIPERQLSRHWILRDESGKPIGVTFYSVWKFGRRSVKISVRRHECQDRNAAWAQVFSRRRDTWVTLVTPLPIDQLEIRRISIAQLDREEGWIRWLYATEGQVIEEVLLVLGHSASRQEAKELVRSINERRRSSTE